MPEGQRQFYKVTILERAFIYIFLLGESGGRGTMSLKSFFKIILLVHVLRIVTIVL